MNISKKSWHYRYISVVTSQRVMDELTTLCLYIRQFLAVTLFYFLCLFGISGLGMIPFAALKVAPTLWMLTAPIVGTGIMAILMGIVFLFNIAKEWFNDYRAGKSVANQNKEPSVFVQYVKDKHSKICSIIKFEE